MENKSIGFIGGGRITKIILQAFKNSNLMFKEIIVFDPNKDILTKLKNDYDYIKAENVNIESTAKCDIIFLAIHPPLISETLIKIKPFLNEDSIIVSLAPKITIEKMKELLNGFTSIVRVNPCATAIINQGINPVSFSESMSKEKKESLISILRHLGKTFEVEEYKIEAYAMISAMGPTYFWFQLQQLKELALSYGFEENEAKEIISEMIKGTLNTLFYSNMPPEEVMDLIPVKPLGEYEDNIKSYYSDKLNSIYRKIKP
ncbi:MAG: pyrroline-5-carboxylate reductase family protein [Ignavibacteria bacterium]